MRAKYKRKVKVYISFLKHEKKNNNQYQNISFNGKL